MTSTKDVYVKVNSLSNFGEHHCRCLQKFAIEIHSYIVVFWLKSNASLSFQRSLEVLRPLELSNIIKCQKWDNSPNQNMSISGDFKYTYSMWALYGHFSIDITMCLLGLLSGVEDQSHVRKKILISC